MKFQLIKTDGTELWLDLPARRFFREASTLIGAELFDKVNLRDGRTMWVDDGGWNTETITKGNYINIVCTTPRKPINPKATALYHSVCRPGTTHKIAGDVLITNDLEFDRELPPE